LETLETQWSHLLNAPDVFPATLPWSMFISPELGKVAVGYIPEPLVFVWRLDSPAKEPQQIRLASSRHSGPNHLPTPAPDKAIWQLGPPATLVFSRHLDLFECNLEMGTSRSVSDLAMSWAVGLAGSSDGKFIAAQDGSRAEMCIVEGAPTYAPVAKLSSHGLTRAIAFSVNNQRLYISTGDFCNVWEPTVFLRAHAAHQTLGRPARISQVTILVASPDGRFYGVVRNSSAAKLHDTTSGELVRQFLPHTQHYGWYNLAWSTSCRYVASVQGHGGEVVVEDLGSPILSDETSQAIVDQFPSPGIGLQLLFDPSDRSLLVFRASLETHGRATPVLLDPRRGNLLATGAEQDVSRGSGLWLSHPTDDTLLLHVDIWGARAFKWDSLSEVGSMRLAACNLGFGGEPGWAALADLADLVNIPSGQKSGPPGRLRRIDHVANGKFLVLGVYAYNYQGPPTSHVLIADLETAFSTGSAGLHGVTERARHVLGCFQTRIVFLDQDSYLCSLDPTEGVSSLRQHFYLPMDWLQGGAQGICLVTKQGMILCPTVAGVAIIQDWFK